MKSRNIFSGIGFYLRARCANSPIFPRLLFRRSVALNYGSNFIHLKDTRGHAAARFISELYFCDYLFSVHFSRFKFYLSSGTGKYECFEQSHLSRARFNYICTLQLHRLSVNCQCCFFRAIGRAVNLFAGAENATPAAPRAGLLRFFPIDFKGHDKGFRFSL